MIETKFKDTEVGQIPEDWEATNIDKLCTLKARIGWQGISGRRGKKPPSVILSIFLNPSPIAIIVMQLPARSCTPLGDISNWFMSVMP